MERIDTFEGLVVPVPVKDVNTDMIIPAQYLTSISRSGFGEHLFAGLRKENAEFPLNLARYQNASILVADANFGCGSSREHAVWALRDWGIRAVIAPSFADIFFSNSLKNGLLLVTLPEPQVRELLASAAAQDTSIRIDLAAQLVTLPDGSTASFPIDPFRKHCLLNGLDDLDYIRSHHSAVSAWTKESSGRRFYSSLKPNR